MTLPQAKRQTLVAILFVLIWATGFIVARGIVPYADPSVFLLARFSLCVLVFGLIALLTRSEWPVLSICIKLLGIGALLNGVYLGAGFWAVGNGLQPAVMSLLGTLQPAITAILAVWFFNERANPLTAIGLLMGMIGVALSVWPAELHVQFNTVVLIASIVSVAGVTAGTLLQKSSVLSVPIFVASAMQNIGACIVCAVLVVVLGESRFIINAQSMALLAYAVLVLSFGGFTLLIWQVRQGSATCATSLLFVVPPLTAVIAWQLFGDALSSRQLFGFVIAVIGVWLARKSTT